MFQSLVYFRGPETTWAGKVCERDVIARFEARFCWVARLQARRLHSQLDPTRCGYAVLQDGEMIQHVEAVA